MGEAHDGDRLSQVFINLIANGRKYCDASAPVLTISVRSDGAMLTVDFVDNGSGIPAEAQDMVFEKFSRVSDQRQAAQGWGWPFAAKSWRVWAARSGICPAKGAARFGYLFRFRAK